MSKALLVSCLLVAGIAVASVCAQQTVVREPGEHGDIYAIYSIMMTDPATSYGPGGNNIYLIDQATHQGYPVVKIFEKTPNGAWIDRREWVGCSSIA